MVGVTTARTRVVLAADDVLLREGLAGTLDRSGFEVVGQAGTAGACPTLSWNKRRRQRPWSGSCLAGCQALLVLRCTGCSCLCGREVRPHSRRGPPGC